MIAIGTRVVSLLRPGDLGTVAVTPVEQEWRLFQAGWPEHGYVWVQLDNGDARAFGVREVRELPIVDRIAELDGK